jgi:hypothetical protein
MQAMKYGGGVWGFSQKLRQIFSNVRFLTSRIFWDLPPGAAVRDAIRHTGYPMSGAVLGGAINEAEYLRVFADMAKERVDGLMVASDGGNFAFRKLLVELVTKAAIPAIYPYSEHVELGGLIPYSFDSSKSSDERNSNCSNTQGISPGEILIISRRNSSC